MTLTAPAANLTSPALAGITFPCESLKEFVPGLKEGDKMTATVKVVMVSSYFSHFGPVRPKECQMVKCVLPSGHAITTFYSGGRRFREGEVIVIKATVKKLEASYKWGEQTIVTRLRVESVVASSV